MNKMRLVGAKEFLQTVKHGELFIQFWLPLKDCIHVVEDFKKGEDIITKYGGEIALFGSNSHSLSFLQDPEVSDKITVDNVTYDCIYIWDLNVVGDANPTSTLYLIFDNEDEWPDKIEIDSYVSNDKQYLSKDDIKRIQKWFNENDSDEKVHSFLNEWALKELYTNELFNDQWVVNYGLTENKKLFPLQSIMAMMGYDTKYMLCKQQYRLQRNIDKDKEQLLSDLNRRKNND